MEYSRIFLTWVVGGVTAIIIGANWFVQAKILNCPNENKGKLARKLKYSGLTILTVGVVFMILAFILWT